MQRRLDTLSLAAATFVVANLLHTLDHLRQGTGDLATEVLAGGTVISILAVLTLVLATRARRCGRPWSARGARSASSRATWRPTGAHSATPTSRSTPMRCRG